jgi:hypothetical protein
MKTKTHPILSRAVVPSTMHLFITCSTWRSGTPEMHALTKPRCPIHFIFYPTFYAVLLSLLSYLLASSRVQRVLYLPPRIQTYLNLTQKNTSYLHQTRPEKTPSQNIPRFLREGYVSLPSGVCPDNNSISKRL